MSDPQSMVHLATQIALALVLGAFVLATIRVIAGPSLADRVLGLDLLVTLAIAFIAIIALMTGQAVYIDIGLALALVGFLATIAFARFIASRAPRSGKPDHALPHVPHDSLKAHSKPESARSTASGKAAKRARGGRHA